MSATRPWSPEASVSPSRPPSRWSSSRSLAIPPPPSTLLSSDERSIGETTQGGPQPNLRALFIPPKEILTSADAIIALHDEGRLGFDDTYYDLAKALRPEAKQLNLPDSLRRVLGELRSLFSGEIVSVQGKLVFQQGEDRFWMSQVAEGIKKIGILARLISNGEIRQGTVLFMDEPETNLHPAAARRLMRMLHDMSLAGVQIAEGMPPNEIVEESLAMGDEDVDVAMRTWAMIGEPGFRFRPPDTPWFRFAECHAYRKFNNRGVREMDCSYWDATAGRLVLLELKDYTNRVAPNDPD
jgi:hypothetical protein